MTEKTANELMDEVVKHPTLDRFLDRHPPTLSMQDFYELVVNLRRERAQFIQNDAEKKEKKHAAD